MEPDKFINKQKLIVVAGPTGVGKSDFGVELARKYNGEIISADSVQVYEGLDIGSGKITEEEMRGIPHHMLGFISPKKDFTVMQFIRKAKTLIKQIAARGKVPMIVGGTGFYINALLHGYRCGNCPPDKKLRSRLDYVNAMGGHNSLYYILESFDTQARTIYGDKVRIIRELEMIMNPKYDSQNEYDYADVYDALVLIMDADRNLLDEHAGKRIMKMIDAGLLDEINNLKEFWDCRCMSTVGYREFVAHLSDPDLVSFDEAYSTAKKSYHALIKKQQTYFRWMKWDNKMVLMNGDRKNVHKTIKEFLKSGIEDENNK